MLWKSLSEASVKKARNGPSTQLIEVTSCVERSNATIKAEEISINLGISPARTQRAGNEVAGGGGDGGSRMAGP